MPLYEYLCDACAHRFERIVKFSDPLLRTCPQCGQDAIEQVISAPAVQFKGSGWYVTDYAHKNSAPGSASPPKSEGGSETVSAGKNDGGSTPSAPAPSNSSSGSNSSGGNGTGGNAGGNAGCKASSNTGSSATSGSAGSQSK